MPRILILSNDRSYGRYLQNLAAQLNFETDIRVRSPFEPCPREWEPKVVILDQEETFEKVRKKWGCHVKLPFIIISENENIKIDHDGYRIFFKPLGAGVFVQALYDCLNDELESRDGVRCNFNSIENFAMGTSPAMAEIRRNILKVCRTTLPVLIQGETGTGKGVAARLLHYYSGRKQDKYTEINCANLPGNLMESELFGHRQGAFTGAWKNKRGRLEVAAGGTVFLDEISEMSPYMQAKLLQVIQDGEFSPLGSSENISVDMRIIAATNADFNKMLGRSSFRKDLYYRLAVITLTLPPLRKRKEDIEILSTYFMEKYSRLYHKKCRTISPGMARLFEAYNWPGNVRELENTIKTLVSLENEEQVFDDLQKRAGHPALDIEEPAPGNLDPDKREGGLREITASAVAEAEKEVIARVLSRTEGNKKSAAELLRISYKSLLIKIKKYGL